MFEAEALPHLRALYGTAYRMTRNAHDAEDLVQETCLRALRAFDRYQPGTNIRAWLFTILHRARTDGFRRQARSPQTVELTGDGPSVPPTAHEARAAGAADRVLARGGRLRRRGGLPLRRAARLPGVPGGTGVGPDPRGAPPPPRGPGPPKP